jgi:hypothetical protein
MSSLELVQKCSDNTSQYYLQWIIICSFLAFLAFLTYFNNILKKYCLLQTNQNIQIKIFEHIFSLEKKLEIMQRGLDKENIDNADRMEIIQEKSKDSWDVMAASSAEIRNNASSVESLDKKLEIMQKRIDEDKIEYRQYFTALIKFCKHKDDHLWKNLSISVFPDSDGMMVVPLRFVRRKGGSCSVEEGFNQKRIRSTNREGKKRVDALPQCPYCDGWKIVQ